MTVALVGPDGAGKSTISRRLAARDLGRPVKVVYMGVNLDASTTMLPTTRLALAVKKRRGGRGDMTMRVDHHQQGSGGASAMRDAKDALRLTLWLAEEWYRQGIASWWSRRGSVVIFDRHFLADYASTGGGAARRWPARLHERLLVSVYPKPGLVVCLDAPGAVLHARKAEASAQWLEERRWHYRQIEALVPRFAVVDVDRDLEDVLDDISDLIIDLVQEQAP